LIGNLGQGDRRYSRKSNLRAKGNIGKSPTRLELFRELLRSLRGLGLPQEESEGHLFDAYQLRLAN